MIRPRPAGVRELNGAMAIWGIRLGDWRVCYAVEADPLIILVLTVARRGNVYERLRQRLQ